MIKKDIFIEQLDEVVLHYNSIRSIAQCDDLSDNSIIEDVSTILTKAKAVVTRIAGINSEYYKDIDAISKKTNLSEGEKLRQIMGTVFALNSDLHNDFLKSLSEIIQSEVFSDYLEMAEHLLNEGYKDPSAVLIGSTLEVHLRKLCLTNGIKTEITNVKGKLVAKKADLMNSDLAKSGVYSSTYQKQVIAWLGIRNSAAHGKYSDYRIEEVSLMLQGIRQFILTIK